MNSYEVPPGTNVIRDEEVVLGRGAKRMEHSVRLVTIRDPKKGNQEVRFVTNRFDLSAQAVADLYRKRWHIELFFKFLKHQLSTLRFFGRSREAIYAQIASAFIVNNLLIYWYHQLQWEGSVLDLMRYISVNLFQPASPDWRLGAA